MTNSIPLVNEIFAQMFLTLATNWVLLSSNDMRREGGTNFYKHHEVVSTNQCVAVPGYCTNVVTITNIVPCTNFVPIQKLGTFTNPIPVWRELEPLPPLPGPVVPPHRGQAQ